MKQKKNSPITLFDVCTALGVGLSLYALWLFTHAGALLMFGCLLIFIGIKGGEMWDS